MFDANKEIYRLDLAVTTNCNLRCKYCFVKKNKKVIDYNIAKKTIKSFLATKGKEKILIIYGGEPLLYFDLVRKIIIFAQNETKQLNKSLVISLGTNGLLLNKTQLMFFKKRNVKLSISLDGQKRFHDSSRVFKNQKGTFASIYNKVSLLLKNIPEENISILFGILPSSAYKMYDNLVFLTKSGFDSINIEPVLSKRYPWDQKQKEFFIINMARFIREIYKNIFTGNFIFLNSVNRELQNKRLSDKKRCPFFENLEVYPQGEIAFSPFLINSEFRNRYIIGNINKGLDEKYMFCKYDLNNDNCKSCRTNYYRESINDFKDGDELMDWRNKDSISLANKVKEFSKQSPIFKEYIREAKKRIFE